MKIQKRLATAVVAVSAVLASAFVFIPAAPVWADTYPSCTMTVDGSNQTIFGTSGDDVICVTGSNDVVNAGDGNDIVLVSGSNDTVDGGNGAVDGPKPCRDCWLSDSHIHQVLVGYPD
jgi:hypothetical protein